MRATTRRSEVTPASRDALRTRRALLDAAAAVIAKDGTGTSLAAIAAHAGVTKGGLLHHFASREVLFEALARDSVERFRQRVRQRVDLSENHPGKLLRAYVDVLCDHVDNSASFEGGLDEYWSVILALHGIPEVARLIAEDAEWWTRELQADGLPAETVNLVSLAVDGLSAMAVCNAPHARSLAPGVRAQLLALTQSGTF